MAGGSGDSLTGGNGQTVPVTFTLNSRGSNSDELGIFTVSAPDGQIGSLLPGQASLNKPGSMPKTGSPLAPQLNGAVVRLS